MLSEKYLFTLRTEPEDNTVYDIIGREWPNAAFFVAECPYCGAHMWTHSLLGELRFNEVGWGVWETPHAPTCTLRRADEAEWVRVDRETYDAWRKGQAL